MHADIDRASVRTSLVERIGEAIDAAGGWLPFSRIMQMALYEPGLGYYASGRRVLGRMPASGSDFVTAPELSPWFGRTLAGQVGAALDACGSDTVWEFGAGSGALAAQLLGELGGRVRHYRIVEVSAALRARQREATATFGATVEWLDEWPERIDGVVVGNEVLDAMPVDLVAFDGERWLDRGVVRAAAGTDDAAAPFAWGDRPGTRRPPHDPGFPPGAVTELHDAAEGFVRSLADRLGRGVAFFFDYGFPESEYYHPQRAGGTLMCHRAHRADTEPLRDLGEKDITAHVDFTGIALAGQDAGLDVVGYTSQGRFLLEAGVGERLAAAPLVERADAQKLLLEHEMGELFKVIAFTRGVDHAPSGFAHGDRRHRL